MEPLRLVMLGGTGFVGRHLVPRLAADGHDITILSRNRENHRELGVLPRVRIVSADVHDGRVLEARLRGADAAINLVGILNEPRDNGEGFRRVHVELTAALLGACRDAGVPRLLQMSALGAGDGASYYLKSRGEADRLVQDAKLAATIFRPSVLFGAGDGLFTRFAKLLAVAPVLPLARPNAMFSPAYVGDVAEAFARALAHRATIGRTYELCGPDTLSLLELVRWTAKLTRRRRLIVPLPDFLGRLQAWVGEWVPGKPFTRDNFRSLLRDATGSTDGFAALGIVATPMRAIVPAELGGDDPQLAFDRYRAEH